MVTDHLEAKSAVINELQFNKPIATSRGDIACHLQLKNTDHVFPLEEGDIVDLFGELHGKRLAHFNASEAKMQDKTRSYLIAETPAEDEGEGKEVVCLCFPILS